MAVNYITTNKDRLAMVDLLKVVDNLTITGTDTNDLEKRQWNIMAMIHVPPGSPIISKGYISIGHDIEEAVDAWFKKAGIERPAAWSLYDAKVDYES